MLNTKIMIWARQQLPKNQPEGEEQLVGLGTSRKGGGFEIWRTGHVGMQREI